MTTAAWVVDRMRQRGLPERGGHTATTHRRQRATPRWCLACREPVWTGLADRHDVVIDPTPTTTQGELFAWLDGRRSYEMNMHDEISRRRVAHIRFATADDVEVYIDHKCGGPHAIPNPKWQPVPKGENDEPPF